MGYRDRLQQITVTINGVDYTSHVDPTTFSITSAIGQVGTCEVTLKDMYGHPIDEWMEIVVTTATSVRIFGGYVIMVEQSLDGTTVNKKLSCSDYSFRFKKLTYQFQYVNKYDAEIIAAVIAAECPGEGFDVATYLTNIELYDRIVQPTICLWDLFNKLATLAAACWWVDYDKKVHFTATPYGYAPYSISSSPDYSNSYPATDVKVTADGSGIINQIWIFGGSYIDDSDVTSHYNGSGEDNKLPIDPRMQAPTGYGTVRVLRNDGTIQNPVWTELTVGAGGLDTLGDDHNKCLYYYEQKYIEQIDPWPAVAYADWLGDVNKLPIKVIGKQEIVTLSQVYTHPASYAHFGKYFDLIVNDTSINTLALAAAKADEIFRDYAVPAVSGSFTTVQPALKAGQLINFNIPSLLVLTGALINKCTITIGVNGIAEYRCDFGTKYSDLVSALYLLQVGLTAKSN